MMVAAGTVTRLLVTMPPRHGKSELISKYFPAWYLGTHPDNRVILASYEQDFATGWGRKARDILDSHGQPLYGLSTSQSSSAASRWDIAHRDGGMIAVGARGAITGRGFHVGIIDDPYKGPKEAGSQTYRQDVVEWYQSVFYTRQEPGASIILVQTRWHEEDLAGYLLQQAKQGGEEWVHLDLPAIAQADDMLGRAEGEALWPARWPLDKLLAFQHELGGASGYYWMALYQQRPQPASGTVFQRSWFRYFWEDGTDYVLQRVEGKQITLDRVPKNRCWVFQTCDPAATEKDENSYFVTCTWAVTPTMDLLLLDVFREHATTVQHKAIMRNLYDRWLPVEQDVEKSAYGFGIIQECIQDGLPIVPVPVDTDKLARARVAGARYQVGTVFHRKAAAYLTDWEDELVAFNKGAYNDQVDNASMAAKRLAQGGLTTSVWVPGMSGLKGR